MEIDRLRERFGANVLFERGEGNFSDVLRLGILIDQGRSLRALRARLNAARQNVPNDN